MTRPPGPAGQARELDLLEERPMASSGGSVRGKDVATYKAGGADSRGRLDVDSSKLELVELFKGKYDTGSHSRQHGDAYYCTNSTERG